MQIQRYGILAQVSIPPGNPIWNGLLAYYAFNSSNGNDSINANNASGVDVTYAAGKNSNCAVFNGSAHLISASNIVIGTAGTINFWLYLNDYENRQLIDGALNFGDAPSLQKLLNVQIYIGCTYFSLNKQDSFVNDGGISPGSFKMITCTWNDTNRKIYQNSHVNADDTKSAFTPTEGKLIMGMRCDGNYGLSGKLDEVAIWNRELSSTEITKLYDSGKGLFY